MWGSGGGGGGGGAWARETSLPGAATVPPCRRTCRCRLHRSLGCSRCCNLTCNLEKVGQSSSTFPNGRNKMFSCQRLGWCAVTVCACTAAPSTKTDALRLVGGWCGGARQVRQTTKTGRQREDETKRSCLLAALALMFCADLHRNFPKTNRRHRRNFRCKCRRSSICTLRRSRQSKSQSFWNSVTLSVCVPAALPLAR